MLVEVRPLDVKKWHQKQGKDSFAQPKDIEVLYNNETGKYATGLTEEEAKKYGDLLGVDLSDKFMMDAPHPYWSTKPAFIKLPNATRIFDTTKAADFVKVKNLKASKFVANSQKEYDEGHWPEATHVIFDEQEGIDAKAIKSDLKREAYEWLGKMTADDKINMVQLLSKKSLRKASPNMLTAEVDSLINDNPSEFLKYIKMGREEVYLRATVLEGLHRNIFTKEGGAVYYMGDIIGVDYDAAVAWFRDPNNQKLKVAILEKLNK